MRSGYPSDLATVAATTMHEVDRIVKWAGRREMSDESLDPDANAEDFLGKTLAPLMEKVAAAYEQCTLPLDPNLAADEAIDFFKEFMDKAPIPKDASSREPLDEMVARSGTVFGMEDIMALFGQEVSVMPLDSWVGFVSPLFAIGIGMSVDDPSSGLKLHLIPSVCREAYDFQIESAQFKIANAAGPGLNLGGSLDDVVEMYVDKVVPNSEACIPQLVATMGIIPLEALPTIFPGTKLQNVTILTAVELMQRMAADGRNVGFDLLKVLEQMYAQGVAQVHVYGEESIESWADKLASFAKGSLIKVLAPALFSNIVTITANHGSIVPPQAGKPARQCKDIIKGMFPWIIGRKFAEEVLTTNGRNEAEETAWETMEAFSENLDQLTWLDQETKSAAKLKLRHIRVKIGWPAWIFDDSNLLKFYSFALEFDTGMKFAEMVWRTKYHLLQRAISLTDVPKDWDSFWMYPPDLMNMMYNLQANDIIGYAAFLQKPLFDEDAPMSFNFGFLGSVYGHELSHGFDSSGATRGPWGNTRDWWSTSAKEKFHQQQACFVDQYSKWPLYGDTPRGTLDTNRVLYDNGKKCLGENIADSGGLGLAFLAYKNWVARNGRELRLPGLEKFSPEQLFFMRYGAGWCDVADFAKLNHTVNSSDPHSVARMRSVGAVQNSRAFGRVFGCEVGARMNPPVPQKCELWGIDASDPLQPGTPARTPAPPSEEHKPTPAPVKQAYDGKYVLDSGQGGPESLQPTITIHQGRWSGQLLPTGVED